jgi:hypothetical protein
MQPDHIIGLGARDQCIRIGIAFDLQAAKDDAAIDLLGGIPAHRLERCWR